MPAGRKEKFLTHRDGTGVTLVRKDSNAAKFLKSEQKAFADAATHPKYGPDIFKGSSEKFKNSVVDDAAFGQVVHKEKTKAKITKTQVTPGSWKTKEK